MGCPEPVLFFSDSLVDAHRRKERPQEARSADSAAASAATYDTPSGAPEPDVQKPPIDRVACLHPETIDAGEAGLIEPSQLIEQR
jgi:hypothetical protein